MGTVPSVVQIMRVKLGVARFRRSSWTPKAIARLGREPDTVLAIKLGVSVTSLRVVGRWATPI
jgi:hypothetical protein